MSRRILVTSNCQTGGVAAALRHCLPDASVAAMGIRGLSAPEGRARLRVALEACDTWVVIAGLAALNDPELAAPLAARQVVLIPHFNFRAFHPDIIYLIDRRSGALVEPHYQSRLVVWAWQHGLAPEDVPRLFTEETMRRLGYLSAWGHSESRLRDAFAACGLDFASFFLRLKRLGVFMHTVNHPRMEALVLLGKLLAMQLGAPAATLDREIAVADAMDHWRWPIYPPIGYRLGLPHGYHWLLDGVGYDLPGFIDESYRCFETLGLRPTDLDTHPNSVLMPEAELDAILHDQLRAAAA
jgi:hypothetical protein